jgi:hypothetical protein
LSEKAPLDSDVIESDFDRVMQNVPKDYTFVSSRTVGYWRIYKFVRPDGEFFETSVVLK